jgi:hypothetical protein
MPKVEGGNGKPKKCARGRAHGRQLQKASCKGKVDGNQQSYKKIMRIKTTEEQK